MFTVLVTGLLSGYLFSKRFGDSEKLAKKIKDSKLRELVEEVAETPEKEFLANMMDFWFETNKK